MPPPLTDFQLCLNDRPRNGLRPSESFHEVFAELAVECGGCQLALEPMVIDGYHGTMALSARNILANGFHLSDASAYYGKGVYFYAPGKFSPLNAAWEWIENYGKQKPPPHAVVCVKLRFARLVDVDHPHNVKLVKRFYLEARSRVKNRCGSELHYLESDRMVVALLAFYAGNAHLLDGILVRNFLTRASSQFVCGICTKELSCISELKVQYPQPH